MPEGKSLIELCEDERAVLLIRVVDEITIESLRSQGSSYIMGKVCTFI